MALGKAVIATRTLGTVDYIQNNHNGILIEHDNLIELKEAISLLIRDKIFRKKLTENALISINDLHTYDIYIKNILELARNYTSGKC
jgi:glycosyltransferase involved in cell wall biosynthesis